MGALQTAFAYRFSLFSRSKVYEYPRISKVACGNLSPALMDSDPRSEMRESIDCRSHISPFGHNRFRPEGCEAPIDCGWVQYSVEAREAVGVIPVKKHPHTINLHISCEISEAYTYTSRSNTHVGTVITGRLIKHS